MIAILIGLLTCFSSFFRSRYNLWLEILALRQQLGVLKRKQPCPRMRIQDRVFWILLRRLWPAWSNALLIVKPETVVAWHRAGFRLFWGLRSSPRSLGRPKIDAELRALYQRMSKENSTYVKRADMWSWNSHAGSCTGLIAASFTLVFPGPILYIQPKPRR